MRRNFLGGRFSAGELIEGARCAGDVAPDLARLGRGPKRMRLRRGKLRIDSRHAASKVGRLVEKGSVLCPSYTAKIPVWGSRRNCKTTAAVEILPPHEVLDALITPGQEGLWTKFSAEQRGFEDDLAVWARRVHARVYHGHWACLAVLGRRCPFQRSWEPVPPHD